MIETYKPNLIAILQVALFLSLPAYGQEMSPEEHASHHRDQAAAGKPDAEAGSAPAESPSGMGGNGMGMSGGGMSGGGMGNMMMDMMKEMGKTPPLELYPSLMNLPDQTPEQRQKILADAKERMQSAVSRLVTGVDRLANAVDSSDFDAMQDATSRMQLALAEFESGVAAQRALNDGQPPQQVAMNWFKTEMNLQTPQGLAASNDVGGWSSLHWFSCALLIVFAAAVIGLYFLKMQRAAALFSRIEANKLASPPGAAPALAGSPPSAPQSKEADT